ncbi:MAG: hypothetical protein AAFU71_08240 [Cyanobacteria bacterium J06632_22]
MHARLLGQPLQSIAPLDRTVQQSLAAQLGCFLAALHRVEPKTLGRTEIPSIDQSWWLNFLDGAEQLIFPQLIPMVASALRSQIQTHIEQLPDVP